MTSETTRVNQEADGWYLEMYYPESLTSQKVCRTVNSRQLLDAAIPQQPVFENGAHIVFDHDFLGKKRKKNPTSGAFELPKGKGSKIKLCE